MVLWSLLAVIIVSADQITKWLVVNNIAENTGFVSVIPNVIGFVQIHNPGAAFNIFSGRIEFLSVISVAFSVGVIWYMIAKKPKSNLLRIASLLLFAGAVGNVIDRIFRGYVVDFIKTLFINFPVFNVADISITCGAVLLIVYILFFDNEKDEL